MRAAWYTRVVKALFFAYSWMLLAAGIILTGVAAVQFYSLQQASRRMQAKSFEENVVISTAHGARNDEFDDYQHMQALVETADARALIVSNFLKRYNSPMKPYDYYGKKLVEIADRYYIDFRLLPAIAMQESNLCKAIPEGSYNCLGFGIHERGTLGFDTYEAGFERAARELKKYYIDRGLTTPELIMTKYTPSSDGSWAASVNQWMAEMRYDDHGLGKSLKTDADVLEFAVDNGSKKAE